MEIKNFIRDMEPVDNKYCPYPYELEQKLVKEFMGTK